jgi:hypothetical protein
MLLRGAYGFGQGNGLPVSNSVFREEAITGWSYSIYCRIKPVAMHTETDPITERIVRLEAQSRRLRIATYLIWPAVWIVSVVLAFAPSRLDEKAMRVFLRWLQETFFGGVVVLCLVLALGFLVKVASDFRGRRSRFALNPGSKRQ